MKFSSEASSETKVLQQQPCWDEKQICGDGPAPCWTAGWAGASCSTASRDSSTRGSVSWGTAQRNQPLVSACCITCRYSLHFLCFWCKKNIDKPELNQQKPPRWGRSPSHARRGCSARPFYWEKGQFWGCPVGSWIPLEGAGGDADDLSTVPHGRRVKGSDTSWSPAQAGDKEQISTRSSRRLDCLWLLGVHHASAGWSVEHLGLSPDLVLLWKRGWTGRRTWASSSLIYAKIWSYQASKISHIYLTEVETSIVKIGEYFYTLKDVIFFQRTCPIII